MTTTITEIEVEESTETTEEIVHACCTRDVHGLFPALCGVSIVTSERVKPTAELPVTCTMCVETMRSYRACAGCGRPIMQHWWVVA